MDCGVEYFTITKTMIINGSVTRIIDTIQGIGGTQKYDAATMLGFCHLVRLTDETESLIDRNEVTFVNISKLIQCTIIGLL